MCGGRGNGHGNHYGDGERFSTQVSSHRNDSGLARIWDQHGVSEIIWDESCILGCRNSKNLFDHFCSSIWISREALGNPPCFTWHRLHPAASMDEGSGARGISVTCLNTFLSESPATSAGPSGMLRMRLSVQSQQ